MTIFAPNIAGPFGGIPPRVVGFSCAPSLRVIAAERACRLCGDAVARASSNPLSVESIKEILMSIFKRFFHAALISAAIAATPAFSPVAHAAGFSGAGFHAGMGGGSGFHGGFRGAGPRGVRTGDFGDRRHDWHQYGYWQNGAWIGIWPGYYDDAYNATWDYYCDPNSPYFDPDVCNDE